MKESYRKRRTREEWSDWACQALHDVGSRVQGLVRASLHVTASSGTKPGRADWDAVVAASKDGGP